jgi:pimeloyl-ACP methyl ester carboxylesterase
MSRDYVARALRESFTDSRLVTESLIDRKYDLMNVEGRDQEAAIMIAQYVRGEPERVLSHVRAPTLVLWGGAEKSLSQETADRFAAALTNARVVRKVVQPGGSHIMHVEMPEPTARAVAAFLEEFPDATAGTTGRRDTGGT